ncbi:related to D-amino acid hydantoin hydrolase (hydantoinase) [Phialocephala subalpina]|uniref:Related to D-amino acid hydantoin hydrolase (Hydantoinase) n=1 Tax=Phialocephala subalpina TaxID=576137 RepID=A0A1L7WIT2_9HELO|nr:related to D-amino acid hydantoin hydrolase (hydantoinase) [Phialocephala subalpina]
MTRSLRIGVDVGGTNTDGVILDPSRSSEPGRGIIAWHKASTTGNPSDGINNAITAMFASSKINPEEVASVTIGTTHFINAVVEQDSARLAKVAIIRLCGPFSKGVPPCIDWPVKLRNLIRGYYCLVDGGLEVDGNLISDINEEQILRETEIIKSKGIKSIVIAGIFSPVDVLYRQEERAASILKTIYPEASIVLSKDVANLGFLERENAAILNASILPFARKTIASFQHAISRLSLKCPVFITQNDGTILLASQAANLPIRTFSSGPTNSMRGAAVLTQNEIKESMMVVDIGGTTTDVGLLLANGFPRQAAAFSEISGVRTNFSYPDVRSIGLGGGSIVRKSEDGSLTIGPDSVGYLLPEKAIVFGGDVVTATDYTVLADEKSEIGERTLVVKAGLDGNVGAFKAEAKRMLERAIDNMKTSAADIPVLLVGGGAIIAPDELKGASKVIKPEWSGVANAIGAATARVSGVVDTIESTEVKSAKEVMGVVSERARKRAVENGAREETVRVVEMDHLPLQYIANKSRFIVKAVGDFDFERTTVGPEESLANGTAEEDEMKEFAKGSAAQDVSKEEGESPAIDISSYKPNIQDREWVISETDLSWISIGCYILGTGGGGSPYGHMLRLREIMRSGGVVRVISPDDLKDDDLVACGGGKGSPTVSIEKLPGDEMMQSQTELYNFMKVQPNSVIALEIGGGNGLQGMILGSSTNMNLPTVDGDWMGRAYPVAWQTTPVVFEEKPVFLPSTICDGNGNVIFMTQAKSELMVEKAFRAALSQMGSHVACAKGPVTGKNTKSWVVEHTISLSWRIGRAVALARKENRIDEVAESIIAEAGGKDAAKVLFKGKIVEVERTLRTGHVYGEVIIEGMDTSGGEKAEFEGRMKIPFKNENILAVKENGDGSETIVASVPDLICVIDAQNGEAIGTPEYRYGLLVIVLGIVASEKWTSTQRGLEIGGPKGFGMDDVEYKALGKFQKPRSVISEYA